MHVYVHVCIYVDARVYMHIVNIYVCVWLNKYVCMYVNVYVHVYL